MAWWIVSVTIVEHHRGALVEAGTKAEALRKAKAAEWESCGEAAYVTHSIDRKPIESAGER